MGVFGEPEVLIRRPLPEPVRVEPGKTYAVGYDTAGVPYVREQPDGLFTFDKPGTVTAVNLHVSP